MPYLDHEDAGWGRVKKPHDTESAGDDDARGGDLSEVVDSMYWLLLNGDVVGVSDWKDSYLQRHLFRQRKSEIDSTTMMR